MEADDVTKSGSRENLERLKKQLDTRGIEIIQKYCKGRGTNYTVLEVSGDFSMSRVRDNDLGSEFWTHTNNLTGFDVVGLIHLGETGSDIGKGTEERDIKYSPTKDEIDKFRQTQEAIAKAKEDSRILADIIHITETTEPRQMTTEEQGRYFGGRDPIPAPFVKQLKDMTNEEKTAANEMKAILQATSEMRNLKYEIILVSADFLLAYVRDMAVDSCFWTSVDNIFGREVTASIKTGIPVKDIPNLLTSPVKH